jgi:hypothetical protein
VTDVAVSVSDDIEVESGQPADAPALLTPPSPAPVAASEEADDAALMETASEVASETPEATEPKPKQPRHSLQARIDKAVAQQREAERRAEAAERALQQYAQPRPAAPRQAEEPSYTRPKPTEDEIGSRYENYPQFIEDLADWKLEQRDAAQAERHYQQQLAERHEAHAITFAERIAQAEETNPKWWSQISPTIAGLLPSSAFTVREAKAIAAAAREGHPEARSIIAQARMADQIFTSEAATELMAYFSTHESEFQRLSTLPPDRLNREMGKLEVQLSRPAAASSGPAPRRSISQAPPPIKPVGTSASASGVDPLSDDLDVDEHIRVMNARDKKTGRFR